MKIISVILNYNDARRTAEQVERLRRCETLAAVVVVDNASDDGSFETLKEIPEVQLAAKISETADGGQRDAQIAGGKFATAAGALDNVQDGAQTAGKRFTATAEMPAGAGTQTGQNEYLKNTPKSVFLLRAEKNRGYGAGNNLGARYAFERLAATHVLIANPDTSFGDPCIRAIAEVFRHHPEVGAASACMHDGQNGLQQTAWPLRPWHLELANSGPVLRRLLRRRINYPPQRFAGKRAVSVGAVHGSMLMLSAGAFRATGGYDEQVFLYCEENILGQRLQRAGYRTALVLTQRYEHENSGSISRTYRSMLPKQRLRQASEYYYYVHYLGIGPVKRLATRLFHALVRMEVRVAERMRLL